MIRKQLFIPGLIILLIVHLSVRAQAPDELSGLRTAIEEARGLFGVPGLAVGIVKDGQVIMNEGFGTRNSATGEPVDSQTIFGIASCSKAFTAACMALMVDDSVLQWEDRVVDHYPAFHLSDPYITNEMRVQDLLCHRSGLQTFDGDLLWYGTSYSRAEVVDRIRHREVTYSFRSRFGYQNVMFIAAGELLDAVTGNTWDEIMARRIFTPLGMASTTTSNRSFTEGMNLAYPHLGGKPMEFLDYDNSGPAASVNSCTDDLLRWVSMWLGKGTLDSVEIFSKSQYYKMTSPMTLLNSGRGEEIGGTHFNAYGLGWFLLDYKGRKVIQHGGGLPGFHSKVVLVPEDNLGIVILANELSGLVESVYKMILDYYLGETGTDWARIYYENQKKGEERKAEKDQDRAATRKKDTSPAHALIDYAGTYEDEMYGQARIDFKNGKLSLTLLPTAGLFQSEMEHWENNTFRITFKDPFLPSGYVTFGPEKGSTVKEFTIDLENPDFHFYKLHFEKID